MEKIVFADKAELEILQGASLGRITAVVDDFAALQGASDTLIKPGNLDSVQFQTDGLVTGEYKGMKLESPLFHSVDVVDGKVRAAFSIREKTEMEKAIDEIRTQQIAQDGAILDLAGIVGGEA